MYGLFEMHMEAIRQQNDATGLILASQKGRSRTRVRYSESKSSSSKFSSVMSLAILSLPVRFTRVG